MCWQARENFFRKIKCKCLNSATSYLSMINENLKEGVQEQNSIGKDATGVEQNRLKTTTERKLILR